MMQVLVSRDVAIAAGCLLGVRIGTASKPVFGNAGASYFLGISEWTFGTLLLARFCDKQLGILGALGSTGTFVATVTIIPIMPESWDVAAGGFPAMTGNVPLSHEGRRSARRVALSAVSGRASADPAMKSQIFIQLGSSPVSAKLDRKFVLSKTFNFYIRHLARRSFAASLGNREPTRYARTY
ncbi:DUF417 family protein [Bradyrhizobium genosp. P]|uniref:DUF417 family protein n=1 Tax=Bradyrhizobium genosp. P TaxID=83641 RepID=UPI003CF32AFD